MSEGGQHLRMGLGEDAHRLQAGRALWLGGVRVESERGAQAHSDGDVLLHALSDALLSALALGDIGIWFPDTDPRWRGLQSTHILRETLSRVAEYGWEPVQVSAVVTLDSPRLGSYRERIQSGVAEHLGLLPTRVGLTFKTSEGLAPDHVQARVLIRLRSVG